MTAKKVIPLGCVLTVLGAGLWWVEFGHGAPIPISTSAGPGSGAAPRVMSIAFHPVPEGPPSPTLTRGPLGQGRVPIQLIEADIPNPLPAPLRQGFGCTSGWDTVLMLSDGRAITYGPCRVPTSIVYLGAAADSAIGDYIGTDPSPDAVGAGLLNLAQDDQFQKPPPGSYYDQPVECRVDTPHGFKNEPVYICAIAVIAASGGPEGHLWEWGALTGGTLHTQATDPNQIPTITGPWDPPWQPVG